MGGQGLPAPAARPLWAAASARRVAPRTHAGVPQDLICERVLPEALPLRKAPVDSSLLV